MSSKIQRATSSPAIPVSPPATRKAEAVPAQLKHSGGALEPALRRDAFIPPGGAREAYPRMLEGAGAVVGTMRAAGASTPGQKIFNAAKGYEGTPTGALIEDAKIWHYQHKPGQTAIGQFMDPSIDPIENCANFVGGILKQTGLADVGTRMFSVLDIDTALHSPEYQAKGWKPVDGPAATNGGKKVPYQETADFFLKANPPFKPGDVVVFRTSQGKDGHVVIYAGLNDKGEPTFIGSNNVLGKDPTTGKFTGADGKILDPQPTYPGAKAGDQQICTLTLSQLGAAIGPGSFAVTSVFRAPEGAPQS